MGLQNKPEKPPAERLAELVAAAAAECQQAEARFAAAEAAAVEASADEAEYDRAAKEARQAEAASKASAERLARLWQAYRAAADSELSAHVDRLQAIATARGQVEFAARSSAEEGRKAECIRHEAALKDIEESVQRTRGAAAEADLVLQRARKYQSRQREQGRATPRVGELDDARSQCDSGLRWCKSAVVALEAGERVRVD